MPLEVTNAVEWLETEYKCTGCGAIDHDRSSPDHKPPQVLNCWQCKAGYQKDLQHMISRQVGMFPAEMFVN